MKFKEDSQEIQFKEYKEELNNTLLLDFLGSQACNELITEHCWDRHQKNLYNPTTTLVQFIQQTLSADKSCKNVVSHMIAKEVCVHGHSIGNGNGAYVKARQKLPPSLLLDLLRQTGRACLGEVPEQWQSFGRPLKGFDGTTLTMQDSPDNRHHFPKHSNQTQNIGLPLARLVVMMSLDTGTIIDYAVGPCKGKGTGESSLLRSLLGHLEPNDIAVADRYYPHFFLLCDIKNRGTDGVFRAAVQRHYDFRQGKRLGSYDHIVEWSKPRKPDWMTREEYLAYPDTIQMREFKEYGLIYVTTLLDPKFYPKAQLIELYKRRWTLETNLNYIKTVMKMNHLTSYTAEMVKKEISAHFIAYNLVRNLMVKAAIKHQLKATQVSFKGAIQLLNQFSPFINDSSPQRKAVLIDRLFFHISKNEIANRLGRCEPRAIKKRPKTYPFLKTDRRSFHPPNKLLMVC